MGGFSHIMGDRLVEDGWQASIWWRILSAFSVFPRVLVRAFDTPIEERVYLIDYIKMISTLEMLLE